MEYFRDTAIGSTDDQADASRGRSPQLPSILAAAPIRVEVTGPGGEEVFRSGGTEPGNNPHTHHYDVEVGGATFSLDLTLDDSEQQEREQVLMRKAYFDELTGVPNRALFERSVNALIDSEPDGFALALIDIDGFKHVNDYYGHATGDRLLVKIAERLGSGLRASDMLARLSGDEFVILFSPVSDRAELERDLDWISKRLQEPFLIDGYEICVSGSIGVSLYPSNGTTQGELRTHADRAMYHGKAKAKGSVHFFNASIRRAADERTRLEQRLRFAIRDRRVCCAFQPKVELRTGNVVGVEVLMRWRDEDGAIQAPGDFIELAIELGLIDDLTHFILAETVASVDRINEAFGQNSTISINVAAKQATDDRFMRSFIEAISQTGFAKRLTLEITEEAFLARREFQDRILPMVREVGARVSIDDFGIGFSSLSALADITADELKIDRSFITNVHSRPRSQSVLKAIEALGHSLGMSIVVEGVECFEELAYLQAATRIELAQGYYFAKPVVFEDSSAELSFADFARPTAPTRAIAAARQFSVRG